MAANNADFNAGAGPKRPLISPTGGFLHPDTLEALPSDRSSSEWQGLEGAKPPKPKKMAEQSEDIDTPLFSAAPNKRAARETARKLREAGYEVTDPTVAPEPARTKAPGSAANEYIKDRIKSAKQNLFGSADDEYEPSTTRKSTDALQSLRAIHSSLKDYFENLQGHVNAEIEHHLGMAKGLTPEEAAPHHQHVADLRAAANLSVRGMKEVRKTINDGVGGSSSVTLLRHDLNSNRLVEADALGKAAEKAMGQSATGVGNVHIQQMAKVLRDSLRTIRKSSLGKLGVLPQGITYHDVADATASAKGLETPQVDYTNFERDPHPETGQLAKKGHVWIGTKGSIDPKLGIRQVAANPDTLAELMNTPFNGRPRSKTHPDVVKVKDAIAEATANAKRVSTRRTDAGLPIEYEPVETSENESRIPEVNRTDVPGARLRPTRGVPSQNRVYSEDELAKGRETSLKAAIRYKRAVLHPETGELVPAKSSDERTKGLIASVGPSRAKELHTEVSGE